MKIPVLYLSQSWLKSNEILMVNTFYSFKLCAKMSSNLKHFKFLVFLLLDHNSKNKQNFKKSFKKSFKNSAYHLDPIILEESLVKIGSILLPEKVLAGKNTVVKSIYFKDAYLDRFDLESYV